MKKRKIVSLVLVAIFVAGCHDNEIAAIYDPSQPLDVWKQVGSPVSVEKVDGRNSANEPLLSSEKPACHCIEQQLPDGTRARMSYYGGRADGTWEFVSVDLHLKLSFESGRLVSFQNILKSKPEDDLAD